MDNENFYSDHVIQDRPKMITTISVQRFHLNFPIKKRGRSKSMNEQTIKDDLFDSISFADQVVKVLKLPEVEPPFLPSLKGSTHSYVFHDVNNSYDKIKKQFESASRLDGRITKMSRKFPHFK